MDRGNTGGRTREGRAAGEGVLGCRETGCRTRRTDGLLPHKAGSGASEGEGLELLAPSRVASNPATNDIPSRAESHSLDRRLYSDTPPLLFHLRMV